MRPTGFCSGRGCVSIWNSQHRKTLEFGAANWAVRSSALRVGSGNVRVSTQQPHSTPSGPSAAVTPESAWGQELACRLFCCAPLPDLLPQPLEWPLFARKRSLRGVVEPGGHKIFRLGTPRSLPKSRPLMTRPPRSDPPGAGREPVRPVPRRGVLERRHAGDSRAPRRAGPPDAVGDPAGA